ncbi:glucokinase [Burkholderiales bacterium]|nr:glucokinase [Burkholderiales bacterium]
MQGSHPAAASSGELILAGDLGGTKTLLALARTEAPSVPVLERRYESREYPDFLPLLQDFLQEAGHPRIGAAVLAAAGPVSEGRCALTYLPWRLDAQALARVTGIARLEIVNDFAATARGVVQLPESAFATLQTGQPQDQAPRVVLGAGTGLGVAALLPEPTGMWRVLAGEGGHIGFAPRAEQEFALARFLQARHGRATAERVLSGPGLVAVYEFLNESEGKGDEGLAGGADAAAAVARRGLEDARSLSRRALDLFVGVYGAFAGDLALLFMARGGVYLAGGIAPKVLPRLRHGPFVEAFHAKAEHAGLMNGFPIHVVLEERVGLLGAAAIAAESCRV